MLLQFIHANVVVRQLGLKGMGMVAKQRINKGSRIIIENPLLRMPLKKVSNIGSHEVEQTIALLLRDVSTPEWQGFWQLHDATALNTFRKLPFEWYGGSLSGKFHTNAFQVPGTQDGAVYLATSRINHSCIPNSVASQNSRLGHLTVHAIQDISDEEEVTISYLPASPVLPHAFRQTRLAKYGFRCDCPLCAINSSVLLDADCKLHLALEAHTRLRDRAHIIGNPDQALMDAKYLVKTYQDLKLEAPLPSAYHATMTVLATHGDEKRVKVFAERVLELHRGLEGHDDEDVEEDVRDPMQVGLSGGEGKWKGDTSEVPVGLDEEAFERWLWREEM